MEFWFSINDVNERMKKYIYFFTIFIINPSFAQDYTRYYKQCNTADSLEYVGKNQEALDLFKVAFSAVEYTHSDKYNKAYRLAIKLNLFDDAYQFGRMMVINSGNKNLLKTSSSAFKKSNQYKALKDSTDDFLSLYSKRVNHDYIQLIDSLVFIDQYIIRGNRTYKGNYKIDKTTLPVNRFELDKSNWQYLLKCIDSLGFPSEKNIGSKAYNDAWVILHHNLRLAENEQYHTTIFEFIKSGDYLPEDFFIWYEQFQMQVHGQTYFTTWDGNISEENLKRIDVNRRKFYLKGINSYELSKNGRSMIAKW